MKKIKYYVLISLMAIFIFMTAHYIFEFSPLLGCILTVYALFSLLRDLYRDMKNETE
jgi:hypothetical protein